MNLPTPLRRPRRSASLETEATYDEDDGIFEIGSDHLGSDDEEEEAFPEFEEVANLNEALGTWGRPGETMDKLGEMEGPKGAMMSKVGALNLGGINQGPTTFYVGTPRSDMLHGYE